MLQARQRNRRPERLLQRILTPVRSRSGRARCTGPTRRGSLRSLRRSRRLTHHFWPPPPKCQHPLAKPKLITGSVGLAGARWAFGTRHGALRDYFGGEGQKSCVSQRLLRPRGDYFLALDDRLSPVTRLSRGTGAESAVGAEEYSPGRKLGVSRLIRTSPGRGGRGGDALRAILSPLPGLIGFGDSFPRAHARG